jgi:hypothetical protein
MEWLPYLAHANPACERHFWFTGLEMAAIPLRMPPIMVYLESIDGQIAERHSALPVIYMMPGILHTAAPFQILHSLPGRHGRGTSCFRRGRCWYSIG